MTGDEDRSRLEEVVNDERARRAHAEAELVAERERTLIWRARAEERGKALRRARWGRARLGRRPRPFPVPASPNAPAAGADQDQSGGKRTVPPLQPALHVAAWNAPAWIGTSADVADLGTGTKVLAGTEVFAGCDLVVVGGKGGHEALSNWLTWPARQPLILWEPDAAELDVWRPHLSRRDVVVGDAQGSSAATRLSSFPAVDIRHAAPLSGPAADQDWVSVGPSTPFQAVVDAALAGVAMRWTGEEAPGPEYDGLVAGAGSTDPARAGVRARLVAGSRFNAAAGLELLCSAAGIDLPPWRPRVGILLVTRRPDRLDAALHQIAKLRYPSLDVVVGIHGDHRDGTAVEGVVAVEGLGEVTTIVRFEERWSLGKCLNQAADLVGSAVLAKFDDDDLYGPWYLDEAVDVLLRSGADLVGKMTQHVLLAGSSRLMLFQPGQENRPVGYVNGPTFVMPRHTWEQVRFPHRRARVDSGFTHGVDAIGGIIHSSSRYEFVLGRQATGHTWEASEDYFLARGEVLGRSSDLSGVWLDG